MAELNINFSKRVDHVNYRKNFKYTLNLKFNSG